MDCPKCKHDMEITHAFEVGPGGKTQRAECPKCFTVVTLVQVTALIKVDPGYGEGHTVLGKALSKDLSKIQTGISSLISESSGKGK